jgi:GT2 family glycosyltransferase
MVQVSIIIVNYNCKNELPPCVQSIVDWTNGVNYEIILVDNASTDDSILLIKKLFPQIRIIENGKNLGFGAANNVGAQVANGEYLLLLNPDTILLNNAVKFFYDFALSNKHKNYGAIGGLLLNERMEPANIGGNFPSLLQLFSDLGFRVFYKKYYQKNISLLGTIHTLAEDHIIDCICGADLFIEKKIFHKIGGFDEDYFLYYEDTDLCFRLVKAGYSNIICTKVSIQHLESVSIVDNRADRINERKFIFFENGKQLFFKKSYGSKTLPIVKLFSVLFLFTRWVVHRGDVKKYFRMMRVVCSKSIVSNKRF